MTNSKLDLVEINPLLRLVEQLMANRAGNDSLDPAETIRKLRVELAIQSDRAESAERRAESAERRADAAEHKAETHVQDAIEVGDKLAGEKEKNADLAARNETLTNELAAAEHAKQTYIDLAASLQTEKDNLQAEYNRVPYALVTQDDDEFGNPTEQPASPAVRNHEDDDRAPTRRGESRKDSAFVRSVRVNHPRTEWKNPDNHDPGDSDDGDDQFQHARIRPVKPPPPNGHQRKKSQTDDTVWAEWQMAGCPVG